MRAYSIAILLLLITLSTFSQEDGYLSETGTNGSTIIKLNKITREVVCNYTFSKNITGISIFSDFRKIILVDSVTVFFDENGNMTLRVRDIKKGNKQLIDSFYYNPDNQLAQISSTSIMNGQETHMGYTSYTYGANGKVSTNNTYYILPNGLTKEAIVENVYNSKNQLIEVWKQSNLSKLVLSERYYYTRKGKVKKIDHFNIDYSTLYRYCWRTTNIFSTNENEYYHKSKMVYNKYHKCVKYVYGDKKYCFTYNPNGTMAESKYFFDEDMVSITQHHYYKD
jgi:hypothetical protein